MSEWVEYISATDVKNWVYCPLIVYFRKVLRLKPKLYSQQRDGLERHDEIVRKISRRVGIALRDKKIDIKRKIVGWNIMIPEERLWGTVDLVVETKLGEIIPVEIKIMKSDRGRPWRDHIYQLTFYAILLEKVTNKLIKRGFIYYVEEEKLVEISITNHEKCYVRRVINSIRKMLKTEKAPRIRINRRRCTGGCGYEWVCKKLLFV